jgi:hypothetical protein
MTVGTGQNRPHALHFGRHLQKQIEGSLKSMEDESCLFVTNAVSEPQDDLASGR